MIDELTWPHWLWLALLALCVGSLLNVVVYRLPLMLQCGATQHFTLWLPRSHCPKCRTPISWHDNIPLAGWLRLHGRCRQCRAAISRRYPLTELSALLLACIAAWLIPPGPALFGALLLGWILLALALIDYDHQLLPDNLTLPLLWLGLLFQLYGGTVALADAVIGAMAGYLCLWLLFWVFRLATGREALGYGDFKLLAALGAWLGWMALPGLLLLAASAGIALTLLARLTHRRPLDAPLPFGPLLALAGWVQFLQQAAEV
ncbi:MAG TPA: prepilin peptidase [Serratia grimesii]|uniref:Prepilin leader peptidase/N-methyltransferase n=1 Tax=Serratia grimesii TaxID=82995 RepID=A0A9C7V728_9GAMM|nr:A24 family peptidase [Serratia grimesii]HCK00060.1 prepilin peptidase [Serratia grimesii]